MASRAKCVPAQMFELVLQMELRSKDLFDV